jgi:hypothetical protein
MQFTLMHIIIIIKANSIFVSYNETFQPLYFMLIVKKQETIKYNKFHQNAEQRKIALHFPVLLDHLQSFV